MALLASETASNPRVTKTPSVLAPGGSSERRRWYQTVAGRLLAAFALIAALTVSAAVLSLTRFNTFDTILHQLIDVSLPAVKLSLGLESNATQIAVTAEQLGKAEDNTQLFRQNEKLTEQIQQLWTGLGALRSAIGETTATDKLQNLVAAIDGKVGELNRATAERIGLSDRRERLIAESDRLNEAVSPLLTALSSQLSFVDEFAEAVYNIRIDTNAVVALLNQADSTERADRLTVLRERYQVLRERLLRNLGVVAAGGRMSETELVQLRQSVQSLLALGDGDTGVFAVRNRELGASRTVDDMRTSLQSSGTRSPRTGHNAGRTGGARFGGLLGAVDRCADQQPDLADPDRGCQSRAGGADRLAIRAALRRGAVDATCTQHAGDRAGQPRRAAAGCRTG